MSTKALLRKIKLLRIEIIGAELTRKERISLNNELRAVISNNKSPPLKPRVYICGYVGCETQITHSNSQGRCRKHQTMVCPQCQRPVPHATIIYARKGHACPSCTVADAYFEDRLDEFLPRLKKDRASYMIPFHDQLPEHLKVAVRELEHPDTEDARHKLHQLIGKINPP